MIADMVTVFMNSARKKSAKRIEEYSVWKPPTSSCSASTRSNGGRFSSAVPAMRKITNGTTPVTMRFQLGKMPKPSPAWAEHDVVGRQRAGQQHDGDHRQPEGGLVATPSGPRPAPSRAAGTSSPTTSRPASRRRRRSTSRPAPAGRRSAGRPAAGTCRWPKMRDRRRRFAVVEVAADRDHREHEEGGDHRQERGEAEDVRSARSGIRSSLKKSLMPSASVWRMPNGPGPVGADAVASCRRGPCARTRS